jgi:hypothetical protein
MQATGYSQIEMIVRAKLWVLAHLPGADAGLGGRACCQGA